MSALSDEWPDEIFEEAVRHGVYTKEGKPCDM